MASATVHALSTGSLTLPERFFVYPSDPNSQKKVPSLSFLVQHHANGKITRLVFDLGMRRDVKLYPEALHAHCESRSPMTTKPDAVESLAKGDLTVDDIDYVLFSHVHYDHVGLPSDFSNPKTKFIIGPGASDVLSGKTKLHGKHSVFEPDLLPPERTIELPPLDSETTATNSTASPLNTTWGPLDPFSHAIDLFNDGTIHILSAPGHMPGHINLLVRTSPSKSALLAGDACHDMRLFTGERDIATWTDEEGNTCCIHADIPRAKQTIQKLAHVKNEGLAMSAGGDENSKVDVEVIFAHDWQWEEDAVKKGRFWPGTV